MKCKNCGHKIVRVPPTYMGKEKFFHAKGGQTSDWCLEPSCDCEKADE